MGFLLALTAAGAASAKPLQVDAPPTAVVQPLAPDARPAPVSFTRMGASLSDGQVFAEFRLPLPCMTPFLPARLETLQWRSSMNEFSDPEFERIFRRELTKAGFKVSGDPGNLFQSAPEHADLQIGALITDFKVQGCLYDYATTGSAVAAVEWQIYSTSSDKVLARIPTRGGAPGIKKANPGELVVSLLQQSFAENVRQLEASPEFRRIVLDPAAAAPVSHIPPNAPLLIALQAPAKPAPLKEAASGAVMVFAGGGTGSGVLISPDGYILTNHHVAGESGRVRVRWSDGTDTVGEVVRGDRRRDVALIKVAAPKGRPLAIRHAPVELGETVFAIGTPLDASLQNTVTKGVVSALRVMEGQPFIQSDTPVTHGNSGGPLLDQNGAVVGLTDLGLDPAAGSTINFFIPIDDALKALAVQPAT